MGGGRAVGGGAIGGGSSRVGAIWGRKSEVERSSIGRGVGRGGERSRRRKGGGQRWGSSGRRSWRGREQ